MYWKMSIDLTRPLVPSMGQHDPLDGFVTYNELQLTAEKDFGHVVQLSLVQEMADMAGICRGMRLTTDDPLGIGGLLSDASGITRMTIRGGPVVRRSAGNHSRFSPGRAGFLYQSRSLLISRRTPPCFPRAWPVDRSRWDRKTAGMDREQPGSIREVGFPSCKGTGARGIRAPDRTDRTVLAGGEEQGGPFLDRTP